MDFPSHSSCDIFQCYAPKIHFCSEDKVRMRVNGWEGNFFFSRAAASTICSLQKKKGSPSAVLWMVLNPHGTTRCLLSPP